MTEAAVRLNVVEEEIEELGKKWRRFHAVPNSIAQIRPKTAAFRPDWRELTSTSAEIAGIGSISAGAWLITPSAGLIAAGVGLVLLGIAGGNKPNGDSG